MDMNGKQFLLLGLIVVAALWIAGCGEKAVAPDGEVVQAGALVSGSDEMVTAGGIRDELNLHGTLLVASRGGLFAVNERGDAFLLNPLGSSTAGVEVCGTRIFLQTMGDIIEIDHSGAVMSTIDVPDWIEYPISFAALPDGGFAVFDCKVDSVYFLDASGSFLQAVDMPGDDMPGHLQIMMGMVVEGKLIVSEAGNGQIAEIDLATYDVGVLAAFEWPSTYGYYGDINHLGRYYYIGRKQAVQRFTGSSDIEDVAVFPDEYNVTGLAIMRHDAYVALNFAGKVYRVNLSSGKVRLVVDGLDYPVDVEFIPVVLEPPAGPTR
jgi:hypothetical protein